MVHAVDRNYPVPLWLHGCKNPWALWDTLSSGSAPDRLARTHQPQSNYSRTHTSTPTLTAHIEGACVVHIIEIVSVDRKKSCHANKYWEVFLYLCTVTLKTPHGHVSVICNIHHRLTRRMHKLPVYMQTIEICRKRLKFCFVKLNVSCSMLIRATFWPVNVTSDLWDLVVANSTFLSQDASCCLPRNLSVNSLTVRYANKPSHLAIWAKKTWVIINATEVRKMHCLHHIILRLGSKICAAAGMNELLGEGKSDIESGPKPF